MGEAAQKVGQMAGAGQKFGQDKVAQRIRHTGHRRGNGYSANTGSCCIKHGVAKECTSSSNPPSEEA